MSAYGHMVYQQSVKVCSETGVKGVVGHLSWQRIEAEASDDDDDDDDEQCWLH